MKSLLLKLIFTLPLLLLFFKLFEIQIIKGEYYRLLSEDNRIKKETILAKRGKIYSVDGKILADTDDSGARNYPYGESLAHLIGYIGNVNQDEANKIDPNCYFKGIKKMVNKVGRSGLEEQYDCILSGIDGEKLTEVDSNGIFLRILGEREAISGEDVYTNIDLNLQIKAFNLMNRRKGSIVITNGKGKILTLVSSPSFDPNAFLNPKTSITVDKIINNPNLLLFNRAISGSYHPGSVFKPLVSLAGLEEGIITKNYTFNDRGYIEIKTPYGDYRYNNWYFTQYGGVEGVTSLEKALARSTDTFYYDLGEKLGIENIIKWENLFELNKKTNIDLPGEINNTIPTPEWKENTLHEKWFLGNTFHISIGQGDLLLTPLSVNSLTSTIASSGYLCEMRVVGDPKCKKLDVKKSNLDRIIEGMRQVCKTGGTAYTFFNFDKDIACKTGTAEVGSDGKTHAWFSAVYPAIDPEIVITVLLENAGEGSKEAGPLARELMDYYVNR